MHGIFNNSKSCQKQKKGPKSMSSLVNLDTFGGNLNVMVFGATGGIGQALTRNLAANQNIDSVFAVSRSPNEDSSTKITSLQADIDNEDDIMRIAKTIQSTVSELHIVLIATGILHVGNNIKPEKSWRALNRDTMEAVFRVNAIGPSLVAKHFLPLLSQNRRAVFAALSARVGSIEDNRLGGWYAYRASKAALNMLIKTLSVELARQNPCALCVGLHPGTVDTSLSKPFQGSVSDGGLFSVELSASHLLGVLNGLQPIHSGQVFAWDGKPIPF
jgi:NAD(P)-dependent dehydrogenase (short-subunit alcohol dehydrogenase family)